MEDTRKGTKFLGLVIPTETHIALRRRSRELDLTMSQLVRRLIAASLAETHR